jgi:hypothetical protein
VIVMYYNNLYCRKRLAGRTLFEPLPMMPPVMSAYITRVDTCTYSLNQRGRLKMY